MFFPHAFADNVPSALPPKIVFILEDQIVQLLTDGDTEYLERVLKENRFAEALFNELQFLGQIPRHLHKDARSYLTAQLSSLTAAAQDMIRLPDDQEIRSRLCTHSEAPEK